MQQWITQIMEQYGYFGILFLIALENIFPPIPSEVILTFGGFMTTVTEMRISGVILFSTIGSTLGAIILYGLGTMLDIDRLGRIVERWGHIFRLTKKDVHKADVWFDKYGVWTVFFCRFIPLIRSLISIPAGMARMNFGVFIVLTAFGTLIWNAVLVNIGAAVGASWESIVDVMDVYSTVIYIGLALLIIIFVAVWVKKRIKSK
ncbi:DedA family protein [Bacillus sp. FJAT-50079]|uniref:DedA family protein n=1 Tax=Bacillus sp. FJAT-50079 TaxID=2833577 RepID=UPI001BC8EEB5|nr:DedA family protein [Bacillus sp. FJAT-50079]MBS4209960.1 DedA family protein [Bacillus sp. FJAT-50079]